MLRKKIAATVAALTVATGAFVGVQIAQPEPAEATTYQTFYVKHATECRWYQNVVRVQRTRTGGGYCTVVVRWHPPLLNPMLDQRAQSY